MELMKGNLVHNYKQILLFGIFTLILVFGMISPVLAVPSTSTTSFSGVSHSSSSTVKPVSSVTATNHTSTKVNIASSTNSCPCIVFRLDTVQGSYLTDVQTKIMDVFQKKNASLTIGVIGSGFSSDSKLVSYLKNNLKPHHATIELANNGWRNENLATRTLSAQISFMNNTNQVLQKMLGEKPNTFVAPYDLYDNDTLKALKQLKMNVISSSMWNEDKFVTANGKVIANKDSLGLYHVPSMTDFQIDLGNESYWASIPKDTVIDNINSHVSKYGYDVILLHPQNFAAYTNGKYANTVDKTSFDELSSIIDYVKSKHMKITTLSGIAGLDHTNVKPVTSVSKIASVSNTTSVSKPIVSTSVKLPIATPVLVPHQSEQPSPKTTPYVQLNGSLTLNMKYSDGDRVGAYMMSLKVYRDFDRVPYLDLPSVSDNPEIITTLPLYHQYKIVTYVGGMLSSTNLVTLDNPTQSLDINIPDGGAMLVSVYYHDGETPIPNASVSVISQDNKTRETVTTDPDGIASKFYLPATVLYGDHYVVNAKINAHLTFSSVPVTLQPGDENDIKLIAPWPSVVQNLVTVTVYNQTHLLTSTGKTYAIDMYDDAGNKIIESPLNIHGEGYFWSMKPGDYVFKVVNTTSDTILGNLVTTLDGSKNNYNLVLQQHSPAVKGDLGKKL